MTFSFDLSKLTEGEKDALILDLVTQLQGAYESNAELKREHADLWEILDRYRLRG